MSPDAPPSLVPVQVRLMGRTLSLRVRAGDEEKLRAWATDLDARLSEFRRTFPTQPEVVALLTVALGLAEEVHTLREAANEQGSHDARLADALVALDLRLAAALSPRRADEEADEDEEAFEDGAEEDQNYKDDTFDEDDDPGEDEEADPGQDAPRPPEGDDHA